MNEPTQPTPEHDLPRAPFGNSNIDQPATVDACAADYTKAADVRRAFDATARGGAR